MENYKKGEIKEEDFEVKGLMVNYIILIIMFYFIDSMIKFLKINF